MARFAWVTLATNDSYSLGALVLGHSLRRVNTAHQLVVLITPSVTEAMKTQLSAVYNVVKVVDVLDSKDADNLALLARPELGITFTKLHCWRLTEFDKCVFLDADTLVLQNSDELFDREELSAAPDAGWPDCFNSGVFVFKPSSDTFKALIEFALIHGSFDGGDQGLLNLFFNDWATKDIKKHLPFVYNMCSTATYSYLPAFKKFGQGLKIIHFIGAAKPWLQPFNTETSLVQVSGESHHIREFVQFWWDMFCTRVHPSLSSEMAGLAGALASLTLGSPLSAEQGALEEHLRRQGWEQGNIDYMGKDSFANIWKKICGTLSGVSEPIASSEVPTPAPVAPIAAPLFVSSVEMSPAGPIDTSPPASYAPVSALTPTVVASDTEAVSKAAPAETSTVAPQPQSPSVTEVASAEVTPSATAVSSQVSTEKAAADSQLVVPSTIEPATQSASESVAKTDISIVPVSQPEPLTGTAPDQSVIVLKECPKEAKTPPTTPVTDSAPVLESLLSQAVVAPLPPAADPPAKADVVSDASPSPTAIQTLPPAKEDISPVESITPEVISTVAPAKTEVIPSAVQDKPLEVPSEVAEIVSSPPIKAETAPEAAKLDNVPASIEQTPTSVVTEVLPPQVALPVGAATTENQVVQGVASPPAQPVPEPIATTEVSTEPVTLPPAAETLASVPPTTTALATSQASPVPTTPAPVQQDTPIVIEPTPAPTSVSAAEIPASVPIEEKPAPVDPTPPASPATPVTPTPAPVEATPTPVQPDTPTVTEPTPPTSPPAVAVESPLAAKLQVDTEVPATPPIEASATQPAAAATGSSEEPPVPPKRKGGSKASQEAKNQKGGKPTKGKK